MLQWVIRQQCNASFYMFHSNFRFLLGPIGNIVFYLHNGIWWEFLFFNTISLSKTKKVTEKITQLIQDSCWHSITLWQCFPWCLLNEPTIDPLNPVCLFPTKYNLEISEIITTNPMTMNFIPRVGMHLRFRIQFFKLGWFDDKYFQNHICRWQTWSLQVHGSYHECSMSAASTKM